MTIADARTATQLVEAYYAAFNSGDMEAFLGLLDDDVVHVINEGGREIGRPAFAHFMHRMNACYRERIDKLVVMTDPSQTHAAAEFVVHGTYIQTDDGLPEAHGQTYRLSAGAFFEIRNGHVVRISNFYSLRDWLRQISG